jgi:predicted TIM-barrel fold metal-dependent hydrolase
VIIDVNAWTGRWNTLIVKGEVEQTRVSLLACGVERIGLSPLEAAWRPNPHLDNRVVYEAGERYPEIFPVPILDPTLPSWTDELDRALTHPRVPMVKTLPGYGGYAVNALDPVCACLRHTGRGLMVQTRLDDPRHQHALARVPDVPAGDIADLAERHSETILIIGGATTADLRALTGRLLTLPNLYADLSQADGVDAVLSLVEAGLIHKLLFGTHTPLFIPVAALARVVTDLTDTDARAILGDNARHLLDIR